ncbi:MAG: sulfatase-like hydrolase/transferase [Hyphomicrobiaceae bacterium]|nr:sulfatase-like hydrolase/transferase [Hyphomicrobiaceae bacterium]
MSQLPNIVLIITDQQRADSIASLGAPWMKTPNIDRLVKEGTAFTHCFVTSPVCVSSRASLFRGMYPHTTNVYTNFEPWEPTWVRWLADAGYHCVNIGKMHINPYDAKGGFHQRFPVENKDRPLFLEEHERAIYDEWDKALKARGLVKPSRYTRAASDAEEFKRALGCFVWEVDDDMHPDNFVGNTARWWLEDRKAPSPFFLQIGFPGPHPPYDPTADALALYADADIPVEMPSTEELLGQPRMHERLRQSMVDFNIDSVAWRRQISREDLLRLRRYYAANVSMIDSQVGEILAVLERRGYLDDTIVIFCSDHADALGDHGHIQKWTMYDCVTRVPLVISAPGRVRQQVSNDLVQLMDLAPTILDLAGIEVPSNWEARSLAPKLIDGAWPAGAFREHVYAELGRDHIQSASEYLIMRRDHRWKFVVYAGETDGELYDLDADPGETRNLWHDPAHQQRRDQAVKEIFEWLALGVFRANRPKTPKPQAPMTI